MAVLSLFLGALAIAYSCKVKLISVAPYFVMGTIVVVYLTAIVSGGDLWFIPYLKYTIVIGAIIVVAAVFMKRRSVTQETQVSVIGIAELCFLAFLLIILICFRNYKVIDWDDLSHWALFPKQIHAMGRIPVNGESISIYSDYLPIQSLYFYWFESDFPIFDEPLLFVSWWSLIGLNCAFIWERVSNKNSIGKNAILVLVAMLLPVAVCNNAFINLKVDGLAGLLFAEIVVGILLETGDESHSLSGSLAKRTVLLAFLVLLKSATVYFVVICMIVSLALTFAAHQYGLRRLIATIIPYAIALFLRATWQWFCKAYGLSSYITAGFSGIRLEQYGEALMALFHTVPLYICISVAGGMAVLAFCCLTRARTRRSYFVSIVLCLGIILYAAISIHIVGSNFVLGEGYSNPNDQIAAHYWNELATRSIGYRYEEGSDFGISFVMSFVIIVSMLSLAIRNTVSKRYVLIPFFIMLFGLLCYMVAHAAMYMFLFGDMETEILSAFSRYILMYFAAFLAFPLYAVLRVLPDEKADSYVKVSIEWGSVVILLLIMTNLHFPYICFTGNNESIREMNERKYLVSALRQLTFEDFAQSESDTAIWIGEVDKTQISHLADYEYCPISINIEYNDSLQGGATDNVLYVFSDSEQTDELSGFNPMGKVNQYHVYRRQG